MSVLDLTLEDIELLKSIDLDQLNNIDLDDCRRAMARISHIEFMKHTWLYNNKPFIEGYHTRKICQKLDEAFDKFERGISSYYAIKCCYRHGKSDIVSRYGPAHFLGRFPEYEALITSHSADLSMKFSRAAKTIAKSDKFKELYPDFNINRKSDSVKIWEHENGVGKAQFDGMNGAVIGSGGDLIVVDDFLKGRAEAESEVLRNKRWECFIESVWTRKGPKHIVIILATPWHVDDIFARLEKLENEDKDFPKFEKLSFPAFDESYPTGTLFPERFSKSWYLAERAALGGIDGYAYNAQMQCKPIGRDSNLINTDKIKYIDISELPRNLEITRTWDLASSAKERQKDDPDYTVGALVGSRDSKYKNSDGHKMKEIYVIDVVRGQWEATERNRIIRQTAYNDGPNVRVGVEAFGPYKDAYVEARDTLKGIVNVKKLNPPGDKIVKASHLIEIADCGNLYFVKAQWNYEVKKTIREFPSGKHDDDVDAIALHYHMIKRKTTGYRGRV